MSDEGSGSTEEATESGSSSVGTQTGSSSKRTSYPYYGYGSEYYDDMPPTFKRIACVRYVRPMVGYDPCGNPFCPPRPPGFGFPNCCDPYGSGCAGQFPASNRVLIIPPRNGNFYRPYGSEGPRPRRGHSRGPRSSSYDYTYEYQYQTDSGSYESTSGSYESSSGSPQVSQRAPRASILKR